MRAPALLALLAMLPAGCARPPASAYAGRSGASGAVALGETSAGEACTQDAASGARTAAILCGSSSDPAARVVGGEAAPAGGLDAALTASTWRQGFDARATCGGAPVPAAVAGAPALRLDCAMRLGGFPYAGLVTIIDGRVWYADGIAPALGPMERSIGVLAGRLPAEAAAKAPESASLAARRAAGAAFRASELSDYRTLLRTARYANNAGDYADAERADASIASLQQRILSPNNPALAVTLADQSVQASNLGKFAEADRLLAHAEILAAAADQPDPNARALVLQDRGLNLLNQHKWQAALAALTQAEAAYLANVPPGADTASADSASQSRGFSLPDPAAPALLGLVEARRAKAVALRHLGQYADSDRTARAASDLAASHNLNGAGTAARLLRTTAFVSESMGHEAEARVTLAHATERFGEALPGSATYGQTALLLAARQADAGDTQAALKTCRAGLDALTLAGAGADPAILLPCLAILDRAASAAAAPEAASLRGEMFEIAELSQGGATARQIAETSARLAAGRTNPALGEVLRKKADLDAKYEALVSSRQEGAGGKALEQDIAATYDQIAAANAAIEAKSPGYDALIQHVVKASAVQAALRPDEALLSIMLGPNDGWSFLVRKTSIEAAPVQGGGRAMASLVARMRASLDAGSPPPPFDVEAAAKLYDAVLRPHETALGGTGMLVVAPSGPLLSIPFAPLLTGPANAGDLAHAPWLVQRFAITHVPAPANFVSLRQQAARSSAPDPWFGFGDVIPPTQAQAAASYPPSSCGRAAAILAGLRPLPGTRKELDTVRTVLGGSSADTLLGERFTKEAVLHADLGRARILHWATHAVMPEELACLAEPALVLSTPPGAPDARGTFLLASDIAELSLNADAVILSACDTGGSANGSGGENVNSLARSFFFSGARSVLVTHWAVNDATMPALVGRMAAYFGKKHQGAAEALASAQRGLIGKAEGELAALAHPYYWAPLAIIGDGGGSRAAELRAGL